MSAQDKHSLLASVRKMKKQVNEMEMDGSGDVVVHFKIETLTLFRVADAAPWFKTLTINIAKGKGYGTLSKFELLWALGKTEKFLVELLIHIQES